MLGEFPVFRRHPGCTSVEWELHLDPPSQRRARSSRQMFITFPRSQTPHGPGAQCLAWILGETEVPFASGWCREGARKLTGITASCRPHRAARASVPSDPTPHLAALTRALLLQLQAPRCRMSVDCIRTRVPEARCLTRPV